MTVMPCPHCWSKNGEVNNEWTDGEVYVSCWKCGARGPMFTYTVHRPCSCCLTDSDPIEVDDAKAEAIRAWNRLALAVNIAETVWLDSELTDVAYSTNYPKLKAALLCLLQEKCRLLDAWGGEE